VVRRHLSCGKRRPGGDRPLRGLVHSSQWLLRRLCGLPEFSEHGDGEFPRHRSRASRPRPVSDRSSFRSVFDARRLSRQAGTARLARCDLLIFQFPVWWLGMPARGATARARARAKGSMSFCASSTESSSSSPDFRYGRRSSPKARVDRSQHSTRPTLTLSKAASRHWPMPPSHTRRAFGYLPSRVTLTTRSWRSGA